MVNYGNLQTAIQQGNLTDFAKWLYQKEIPTFETLTRLKRKIQEEEVELAGDKEIRMQIEQEVREWCREN